MTGLTLKIVTPDGMDRTVDCDSILLWMAADTSGKGEGSIGIRQGHVNAVIALGNGPIEARLKGSKVFEAETEGGFATVMNDTVTVVTQHLKI